MRQRIKGGRRSEGSDRLRARTSEEPSPEQQPPVFSLRYLQSGRYCLSSCELREKAAFADKIHRLSQLTWSELGSQHRHKLGYEKIPRRQIRAGAPPHIREDVESFLVFRFNGMAPMVGYRDKAVFYVLWLDRDFSLYDHE